MNACISESGCVWINSTCSVSLLEVKLWDLVIKKYMRELFSFYAILPRNHRTVFDNTFPRWRILCARVLYALLSVAMCVWSARDVLYTAALLSVAYVCVRYSAAALRLERD